MSPEDERSESVAGEVEEQYDGPAQLIVDGREIDVRVHLSGHFEPIAGRYQWAGRLQPDDELDAVARPNTGVRLRVADGPGADATLREHDPWGGLRISGTGRPPFPVPTEAP